MRALVIVSALLLVVSSMALAFKGQQFFDEDVPGEEFVPESIEQLPELYPSDECSDSKQEPDLEYDYEGEYENT